MYEPTAGGVVIAPSLTRIKAFSGGQVEHDNTTTQEAP
jgi:hypothetical protein